MKLSIIAIILLCTINLASSECIDQCKVPIDWDTPELFCLLGINGTATIPGSYQTIQNAMCGNVLGITLASCEMLSSSGEIIYPGTCGCPNDCFASLERGTCVSQTCICSVGWTGPDCSIVKCPNNCSGHGSCENNFCYCEDGYALNDCSQKTIEFPDIPMSVTGNQYVDDKYGNDHPIFNRSTISQIYINTSLNTLEYLLNPTNVYSDTYFPASMYFYSQMEQKYMNIGMRLKGVSSRIFVKKSWKISFENSWKGVKGFYLKSAVDDPTYAREQLSTVVAYSMASPIPRLSYTSLYINNVFYGLYYIIENVDHEFLKSRFGNKKGALYKCNGSLRYMGSNPVVYKLQYQPETAVANDSYTDLIHFIFTLNNASNDVFAAEIQKIFDVDLFIRTYIMEVATGNYDGIWNGNNYYLYLNPETNQFQYFRHDLDLSYGMFVNEWGGFANKSIYNWTMNTHGAWILPTRILQVPLFMSLFKQYFMELLSNFFHPSATLDSVINILQTMSSNIVQQDYWHHLDYSWSYKNYLTNYESSIIRELQYIDGIQKFIEERWKSAYFQLIK